jgi:two-component system phosphate regulon sensor histidine kinase PhoR
MRRDFIANVSHEIRTPLTVLAGFVETLQSVPLAEPERERYLSLMAQQANRMQTLVSDLLTLSRLEGSPPPDSSNWMPITALTNQLEQEAHALSAALDPSSPRTHAVLLDCPPGMEIAGSNHELFSAMSNLVCNAIRYTPRDGEIRIRTLLLPDGRAEFSVTDCGPGIAPEHLPRLTERFYRVDHSRSRETGGTGLGLAIVKHVAQRHGAVLKIDSTPGRGSVFTITFPASRVRTTFQDHADHNHPDLLCAA